MPKSKPNSKSKTKKASSRSKQHQQPLTEEEKEIRDWFDYCKSQPKLEPVPAAAEEQANNLADWLFDPTTTLDDVEMMSTLLTVLHRLRICYTVQRSFGKTTKLTWEITHHQKLISQKIALLYTKFCS